MMTDDKNMYILLDKINDSFSIDNLYTLIPSSLTLKVDDFLVCQL